MQLAVGFICVALGVLHFLDRGRMHPAARRYYVNVPMTPTVRGALALVEVTVGFVLVFLA